MIDDANEAGADEADGTEADEADKTIVADNGLVVKRNANKSAVPGLIPWLWVSFPRATTIIAIFGVILPSAFSFS